MNTPMSPGLAALFGGPSSPPPGSHRRGLPEAQVMRLQEVLDLYRTPNPYRVGDLVELRPRMIAMDRVPCLVVDVLARPTEPSFGAGACCADERFDMRVASVSVGGDIVLTWVASFRFAPLDRPAVPLAEAA